MKKRKRDVPFLGLRKKKNMENKRLVMCTSTGCLEYGPERYSKLGIDIIRIHLFFKGQEYLEGFNLDPVDLYKQMENTADVKDNLPHTAMPTYEEIAGHFEKAIHDGYNEIICIAISSGLGGTVNFIRLVSEDFKDRLKFTVIDARITCFPEGFLAVKAKTLVDKGVPTEEIVQEIEWIKRRQEFIGLDEKLDYLIYNGRLKGGKAYLGKLMKIVPVLHFDREGCIVPLFNCIGIRKGLMKVCEMLKKDVIKDRSPKDYLLFHVYTGPSTLEKLKETEKKFGIQTTHEDVIMSPVSGIHNGPWLAGYCYIPLRRDDEPLKDE